MRSAGTAFL